MSLRFVTLYGRMQRQKNAILLSPANPSSHTYNTEISCYNRASSASERTDECVHEADTGEFQAVVVVIVVVVLLTLAAAVKLSSPLAKPCTRVVCIAVHIHIVSFLSSAAMLSEPMPAWFFPLCYPIKLAQSNHTIQSSRGKRVSNVALRPSWTTQK